MQAEGICRLQLEGVGEDTPLSYTFWAIADLIDEAHKAALELDSVYRALIRSQRLQVSGDEEEERGGEPQ